MTTVLRKSSTAMLLMALTMMCVFPSKGKAAPALIQYRGVMTDLDNVPISGPVVLQVGLYPTQYADEAPLKNDALWLSAPVVVNVENGQFSLTLGQPPDAPIDGDVLLGQDSIFLAIWVAGEPLLPLQELFAVPVAAVSNDSERLLGIPGEEVFAKLNDMDDKLSAVATELDELGACCEPTPVVGCGPEAADGDPCNDGNPCTKDDCCYAGVCIGVTAVECDDGNPCTKDFCAPGVGCLYEPQSIPTTCSDNDACTTNDVCIGGKCQGLIKACNDNNPCTSDTCDPAVGCLYVPNSLSCDDGNVCSNVDVCVEGLCKGGPPLKCVDGNPCTTDYLCHPKEGCYFPFADGESCDDKNKCTGDGFCLASVCLPGQVTSCDDGNVCTDDSCEPSIGCKSTPNTKPCDDKNACTEPDSCSGGVCIPGPPKTCPDNLVCTDDSCNPAIGCVYQFNDGPCNDGNACTTSDHWTECKCVGSAITCDDGNVCTHDLCDPSAGCKTMPNTAECDDGNACTTSDSCKNGQCKGGTPLVCNDGNPCTDDYCNPMVGCAFLNNAAACNDGNACTILDMCNGGKCSSGPLVDCDDSNPCTNDTCDPQKGCFQVPNSSLCDDGNACTTNDLCAAGVCVPGAPKGCDDNNACTTDKCDPVTGNCNHIAVPNFTLCNDSNACTVGDFCSGGLCTGDKTTCVDDFVCTKDDCDPQSGCKFEPLEPEEVVCPFGQFCNEDAVCEEVVDCGEAAAALQPGAVWPMRSYCPTHVGRSPHIGPLTHEVKWAYDLSVGSGAQHFSSPAIDAEGNLYVGSAQGVLHKIKSDGSKVWTFATGGSIWSSPAIGSDGSVYFGSNDGKVYAVTQDGDPKWQPYAAGAQVRSSVNLGINPTCANAPTLSGQPYLVVGTDAGDLLALDPQNGQLLWKHTSTVPILSSPAISDLGVWFGANDLNVWVYAVSSQNCKGKYVGSFQTNNDVLGSVAITKEQGGVVGGMDGWAYQLNAGLSQVWKVNPKSNLESFSSSPAIGADGTIVIGRDDGLVYALEGGSGATKWTYVAHGPVSSTPSIDAMGNIFVGDDAGWVHSINSAGQLTWKFQAAGAVRTTPVIGKDGCVYVGSDGGLLYALCE